MDLCVYGIKDESEEFSVEFYFLLDNDDWWFNMSSMLVIKGHLLIRVGQTNEFL